MPELLPDCHRIVIVAPHPDDEVLGAASFLCQATLAALPCIVVAVTDGEASHPGSSLWPPDRLTSVRARESARALALLAPQAQRLRLGLPDGAVTAQAAQLAAALRGLLRPRDTLLCPWRDDGHPDHEACGRVCAVLAREFGCPLLELPIWTWHWAEPGDARVPWQRAAAIALTADQLALKQQAVACFSSQLQPDPTTGRDAVLPGWARRRWLRSLEVVLR